MRKYFVLGYILFVVGSFAIPLLASAHIPGIPYWGDGGLVSCTGAPFLNNIGGTNATPNNNACQSLCDLIHTLVHILSFAQSIAIFLVAPILFGWGGMLILISGGSPGQLEKGKKIFTGTLIGVLITLGAYLILATIIKVFSLGGFIPGFDGGSVFNCNA